MIDLPNIQIQLLSADLKQDDRCSTVEDKGTDVMTSQKCPLHSTSVSLDKLYFINELRRNNICKTMVERVIQYVSRYGLADLERCWEKTH